jgi:hypothetical protein
MCTSLKVFSLHEKLVLKRAINTVYLVYTDNHPHLKEERIASLGVRTVFKFKFPDLVSSSNILVVFDDLMQRLAPGLRLEVAIWYINYQEVGSPLEQNIDELREFHTNLDIISQILRTDRPQIPRRHDKEVVYDRLMSHWSLLKNNFLVGHIQ